MWDVKDILWQYMVRQKQQQLENIANEQLTPHSLERI